MFAIDGVWLCQQLRSSNYSYHGHRLPSGECEVNVENTKTLPNINYVHTVGKRLLTLVEMREQLMFVDNPRKTSPFPSPTLTLSRFHINGKKWSRPSPLLPLCKHQFQRPQNSRKRILPIRIERLPCLAGRKTNIKRLHNTRDRGAHTHHR